VNTSVTQINLEGNKIDAGALAPVKTLLARNKRLRHLFLFDARKMLLSLMCAEECGVVWPYLLDGDDLDVTAAPANVETLRAELTGVVEERVRRAAVVVEQRVPTANDTRDMRAAKRRRFVR
jgi:hypothetical protein